MKINFKLLAAGGLLILSAVIVIHQAGQPPHDSARKEPAPASSAPSAPKLADKPREPSAQPTHPAAGNVGTAASNTARATPPPQSGSTPSSSAVNLPAAGFQLADDVQLPAVILALSAAEKNPQKKVSEPIATAMRGIIDRFYQDLAESARGTTASGDQATATQTGTDGTIIIQKGPAVERARARANETYRALFGNEAFNQMTRDALLESQLPADAGTSSK